MRSLCVDVPEADSGIPRTWGQILTIWAEGSWQDSLSMPRERWGAPASKLEQLLTSSICHEVHMFQFTQGLRSMCVSSQHHWKLSEGLPGHSPHSKHSLGLVQDGEHFLFTDWGVQCCPQWAGNLLLIDKEAVRGFLILWNKDVSYMAGKHCTLHITTLVPDKR